MVDFHGYHLSKVNFEEEISTQLLHSEEIGPHIPVRPSNDTCALRRATLNQGLKVCGKAQQYYLKPWACTAIRSLVTALHLARELTPRNNGKTNKHNLKSNPDTLHLDLKTGGATATIGSTKASDVQFYTEYRQEWKTVCLAHFNKDHEAGLNGIPYEKFTKNDDQQIIVPCIDNANRAHTTITFFDTGIVMVQGEHFRDFPSTFPSLKYIVYSMLPGGSQIAEQLFAIQDRGQESESALNSSLIMPSLTDAGNPTADRTVQVNPVNKHTNSSPLRTLLMHIYLQ